MTEQKIKQDGHIHLADGRSATLTAVQFPDGACQVTLLTNDIKRERIAFCRCSSVDDALYFFDAIKEEYHIPELTGKYQKLADDLKAALAYGLNHKGTDDGGTSNLDVPTISRPGWDQALVMAAAKLAGLRFFEWEFGSSKAYVFSVPGVGQGYTRTYAAEAMSHYLKEQGYAAGMYYQMD